MSAAVASPTAHDAGAALDLPGMTVIVPTLNRGGYLLNTLRDLVAQSHRPLEILVVDQSDARDPEVDALVAAHGELIRYHRVALRGLPQARNYGWQHAHYDYLLYVDDDIRCGPDLVSEHLRILTRPGTGLVGGGIDEVNKPADLAAHPASYNVWSASPTRGFGAHGEFRAAHVPGGNFSAPRELLERAGGVDESLSSGASLYEETDLALRIAEQGYAIRFNGSARVRHLAAASGGCRTDEVVDYVHALAHNRAVLIRRHSRAFQVPVAGLHLASTALGFAWHYRSPGCLLAALRGAAGGWRDGGQQPKCSVFAPQNGGRP